MFDFLYTRKLHDELRHVVCGAKLPRAQYAMIDVPPLQPDLILNATEA